MKAADGLGCALASFPITAPSLLFLLLMSSAWLTHVTRRELPQRNSQMEQLDLLSSSFVMLQSFQVDSGQSAPAFWSERLGQDQASLRWNGFEGRIWWKGWLSSGSSVLVLPRQPINKENKSALNQLLPGFELVFSDTADRSSFTQSLRPQPGEPSPLERFCLRALQNSTAVRWTPEALLPMAGPLATMLNSASSWLSCSERWIEGSALERCVCQPCTAGCSRRLKPPKDSSAPLLA